MTGLLYERKCVNCDGIMRPYSSYPLELTLKEMGGTTDKKCWPKHTHHIQHFACSNCDLVQFFEVDEETVRYFEDLLRFKMSNEVHNPTKECKDCGHLHRDHDRIACLGVDKIDGKHVQNCTCHKFAFNKTVK